LINAKDISSQRFEKAAFGYKQEDVDEYLNEIASEYSKLQKENEEINKKLQILADKVREYRQDEEAVKDALLMAQKEGHRAITDAKIKADEILNRAKIEAEKIINDSTIDSKNAREEIIMQLKAEQKNLLKVQKYASDFKKDLFDMYKEHLEIISSMPELEDDEDYEDDYEEENSTPEIVKPQVVEQKPAERIVEKREETSKIEIKPDPFRTQSIPAIKPNIGELKFGQQNKN